MVDKYDFLNINNNKNNLIIEPDSKIEGLVWFDSVVNSIRVTHVTNPTNSKFLVGRKKNSQPNR